MGNDDRPIAKDPMGGVVVCLWCQADLFDGRIESGFTGEGPDYCLEDGDFGCDQSPDTGDDGTGSHTPEVVTLWDGNIVKISMFHLPYGSYSDIEARSRKG